MNTYQVYVNNSIYKEVTALSSEALGKIIKRYRNNQGYSTQLLAEKLNISTGLLNNIENARNDSFNLELLNMIIKELNIPISELQIFEESPIPTTFIENDFLELKIPLNCKIPSDKIKDHIESLLQCYLNTITSSKFNENQLALINCHLLEELNFIKKLK